MRIHHVLGVVIAAQHGPHGAIDALVVASHEDLEERRVAFDDASNELFIRGLFAECRGQSGRHCFIRVQHR